MIWLVWVLNKWLTLNKTLYSSPLVGLNQKLLQSCNKNIVLSTNVLFYAQNLFEMKNYKH